MIGKRRGHDALVLPAPGDSSSVRIIGAPEKEEEDTMPSLPGFIKCPKCRTDNGNWRRRCKKCGADLKSTAHPIRVNTPRSQQLAI